MCKSDVDIQPSCHTDFFPWRIIAKVLDGWSIGCGPLGTIEHLGGGLPKSGPHGVALSSCPRTLCFLDPWPWDPLGGGVLSLGTLLLCLCYSLGVPPPPSRLSPVPLGFHHMASESPQLRQGILGSSQAPSLADQVAGVTVRATPRPLVLWFSPGRNLASQSWGQGFQTDGCSLELPRAAAACLEGGCGRGP
jgi:hypothetical protein